MSVARVASLTFLTCVKKCYRQISDVKEPETVQDMSECEKRAFISLGGMGILAGTEPKLSPTSLMVLPLEVYVFLFLGICQLNVK